MPHGMTPPGRFRDIPRVWVLLGNKAGDNSQVIALAEALGWPFEAKTFVYRKWEAIPNFLLGTTLAGVDTEQSSRLDAPWPDLVLSAGRRNEPVARWIKAQGGDRVQIVHVGRPWTQLHRFDLIITTPQYRLPKAPNVLENSVPLHRVTHDRLIQDGATWAPRFAHLPKPYTAVIIGGSSTPYVYDDESARRLARQASTLAKARGGSLLVTTSARTPASSIDAFCQVVDVPYSMFRWSKGAAENPYFGILDLADDIIVTGDSMSMLAEACATGKPVHIFDLGEGRLAMRRSTVDAARAKGWRALVPPLDRKELRVRLSRFLFSILPERLSRDIRIIQEHLVASGQAVWLGDPLPERSSQGEMESLGRAARAVHGLLETKTEADTMADVWSWDAGIGQPASRVG